MRRLPRRVFLLILGLLAGLAVTGGTGAYFVAAGNASAGGGMVSAGPHYAPLPSMSFTLTDGSRLRVLHLRVTLELDRTLEPKAMEGVAPRILSTLGTRMVDVGAAEVAGALGTLLVKDVVTVAANREIRPARVRDVLLQEIFLN